MTDGLGIGPLVGSWRLRSVRLRWCDTGEVTDMYGPNPDGAMVLTAEGRVMFLFGPAGRLPPMDDADCARLFRNLAAYTGLVRMDGPGRFITTVDYAWNPAWTGEQMRFFTLEGDRLEIRTPEQTHPSYGDRRLIGELAWERERG